MPTLPRLSICLVAVLMTAAPPAWSVTSDGFAEPIEQAHGRDAYYDHAALRASFTLTKGGEPALAGTMLFDTPLGKSRLDLEGGTTIVFDGSRAWVTPADSELVGMGRFHVLTWPYFLVMPFKLSDPGVNLQPLEPAAWQGTGYDRAKMTFEPGTGDAPDDWYILYRDPQSSRLDAAAYIVTYSKSQEKAEEEPHAAVYHEYREVDGVLLPTRMTIHHWSEDEGPHGEPLYDATFSDFEFVEPEADTFAKPDGAAESKLPEAAG